MKAGQPTNAKKHLNEKHRGKLKEIDTAGKAKQEVSVPILNCYFSPSFSALIPKEIALRLQVRVYLL